MGKRQGRARRIRVRMERLDETRMENLFLSSSYPFGNHDNHVLFVSNMVFCLFCTLVRYDTHKAGIDMGCIENGKSGCCKDMKMHASLKKEH